MKKYILLFSFVGLFVSCSQRTFDSKEDLVAHITDAENGYTQHKLVNGVDFSITYRPTDLLVSQELTEGMSEAAADSLRQKYGQYLYFNVSISKNNQEVLDGMANSRAKFGAMVNQLVFGMGDKVHLYNQKKDTVELLDYIYPREYGMGRATNIMFVYPREEALLEDDFIHFTLEDIGLKTGEVGFKFPAKLLEREVALNF